MKPGPRIVKGRTARQRAAAKRYSATVIRPSLPAVAALMPTTSWWVGIPDVEFTKRAQAARSRIQVSRFGRVQDPTFTTE